MRRSTLEDWLAPCAEADREPAHDPATCRVPAPAKVQALVRAAQERGATMVTAAEFRQIAPNRRVRRGHGPRVARNTRTRGSRRRTTGSRTTSSGEDDPPASERACANCNRPLPPDSARQRSYCERKDCKRDRDRKRKSSRHLHLRPRHEHEHHRVHWQPRRVDFDRELDVVGAAQYIDAYGSGGPKVPADNLAAADQWELWRADHQDRLDRVRDLDVPDQVEPSRPSADRPRRLVAGLRPPEPFGKELARQANRGEGPVADFIRTTGQWPSPEVLERLEAAA